MDAYVQHLRETRPTAIFKLIVNASIRGMTWEDMVVSTMEEMQDISSMLTEELFCIIIQRQKHHYTDEKPWP